MENLFLLPKPQKLIKSNGYFTYTDKISITYPDHLHMLEVPMRTMGKDFLKGGQTQVYFTHRRDMADEAYELVVEPEDISIYYGHEAGAFYALMSLRQLAEGAEMTADHRIPCCSIEDAPILKIRGFMMDISRGKVPSLETLKQLIDLLASMKYNHLELYIEGFSFAYPSFRDYWKEDSVLTPEEIQLLDQYCSQRFIDLVPNQNSFGHMAQWLQKEELRPLAEAPDGWSIQGLTLPPTTLDARNEKCMDLLNTMMDDLLPNFTSNYLNVDMDEPFDMGMGKNQDFVKAHGNAALYLIHALNMYKSAATRGKTMMMWGDVIAKHPELVDKLPEDMIILDWGYSAQHLFDAHAKLLGDHGRSFITCPGTNSWSTFAGFTDNMLDCIKNAADAACRHGGLGMLLTDWGDGGHVQYLPVSYAPMMYAAALAWNNTEIDDDTLAKALDTFVFKDRAKVMGHACLDAGRYERYEEFYLATRSLASIAFSHGRVESTAYWKYVAQILKLDDYFIPEYVKHYQESFDNRKDIDVKALDAYLVSVENRFERADPQCGDGGLILAEYKNALELLRILSKIRDLSIKDTNDSGLIAWLDQVLKKHEELWMARNKRSGLALGLEILMKVRKTLE